MQICRGVMRVAVARLRFSGLRLFRDVRRARPTKASGLRKTRRPELQPCASRAIWVFVPSPHKREQDSRTPNGPYVEAGLACLGRRGAASTQERCASAEL